MTATTATKQDIRNIAIDLMEEHGLYDWSFEWDNAKRRAGVCRYRDRVIGMSRMWAEHASDDEIIDTILHEIAHALVGPGHGHGPRWRAMAKRIGCNGDRCASAPETAPKGRYEAVCRSCSKTVAWRWRLSANTRQYRHSACMGKMGAGQLDWYDHGPQGR